MIMVIWVPTQLLQIQGVDRLLIGKEIDIDSSPFIFFVSHQIRLDCEFL